MISSLRGRLVALHLAALAVTVLLFAALAYAVLSRHMYRHHDEELAHQAEDVVRALGDGPLTEEHIKNVLDASSVRSRLVLVRDHRGELLYREPILDSMEPNLGRHTALIHAATSNLSAPEFFTVDLERSGETRFICAPLQRPHAYLQIGDPLGDVRATLHATVMACLPLIPAVLLLSSFGGWFIAKRALAPMQTMSATLREIHASDLSRRVEVHAIDAEVGGLATTLNQLLARLQRAFDSLRQFAGDVSHQLQTPLTVMKAGVEAGLRQPDRSDADRKLLEGLVEEINGMSSTVSDLRTFALADAPVHPTAPIDLSAMVRDTADIISALAELREVSVAVEVQPGIDVLGDAVRLKQVVLNLGDNAVKYTPRGGTIGIRLTATATDAILVIQDSGQGISAENIPRLFDRLFRVEAADRSTEGTGLGLAIAKRIIDAHQGTIEVNSTVGVGSTFTVRLSLTTFRV